MAKAEQNPSEAKTQGDGSPSRSASAVEPSNLFPGLDPKLIEILYREAPIQTLSADQPLFAQNSADSALHIVLKGGLRLYRSLQDKTVSAGSAQAGEWLLPQDYAWEGRRTAHCVAQASATVMTLSEGALATLDPLLTAGIYKIMVAKAMARATQRGVISQQIEKQNRQLRQALFLARGQRDPEVIESEIVQNIITKIPRLPAAASTLATKLMDENLPASEAAELVKSDPSLTGMILKTINSSFYSFQQKISDVNHALVLLGFTEVYQMIMGESLRKTMPDTPEFRRLYVESLIVSQLAFTIAQRAKAAKPSETATIGLLSNIGRVVLGLLRQQNPKLAVLVDQMDPAQMGALLLKTWNLPEMVWRSIDYLDYPQFAPPAKVPDAVLDQVALVALARHCYRRMLHADGAAPPTLYLSEYAGVIGWGQMPLPEMIDQQVVPGLQQRRKQLPVPVSDLLDRYLKQKQDNEEPK